MGILVIAAACAAALALVQLALAWRVRANVPKIVDLERPSRSEWPQISIVVPARDEAARIEQALASKLACGYPNLEIIVVDDRSTDETGAIAARLAASDPRLVVARVDDLPAGWLGKVNAMAVGAARARGEFLLFSDADVHIEPGVVERTVAHAEANAVDLVAIMPRLAGTTVVLDACMASMMRLIGLVAQTWRANDDRSNVGVGVGAFSLVRRRALEASPGLAFLRMEMADDVALGAMLKATGARCRFFASGDGVHLVYTERLGALARNMEKGGGLLGFSLIRTSIACLAWFAIDIGIPVAAIFAGGAAAAFGVTHLAAQTLTHWLLARQFGAPERGALLWPVGVATAIVMLARSGALAWARGGILWRGTRYSKAEMDAGRRWVNGRIRLLPRPT